MHGQSSSTLSGMKTEQLTLGGVTMLIEVSAGAGSSATDRMVLSPSSSSSFCMPVKGECGYLIRYHLPDEWA